MKNSYRVLPVAFAIAATMAISTQATAGDLTNFSAINQTQFLALSKDLAAATSTKAIEPAAPLGLTGFDISAAATATKTTAGSVWGTASGDSTNHLLQTKLSASKGLPWGVDVGGFVSQAQASNITASGIHAKYALLEGNAITPAISLRASHSRMGGVSQMSLNNSGLELLISKGFVGVTPYAGVGTVYSVAKANGKNDETFTQNKSFVGVSLNMLLVNLSAEYDRTGKTSSIGVKAGVRF